MDIFEAIKTRRSIRAFQKDKPVDEATVQKILEAGIAAPSSGNSQCGRFFVVRDVGTKKRLALEAGHQKFIDEAPIVIVVVADMDVSEKSYGERGRNTYSLQDTAVAIENMLLATTALGLGSCWVGAFNEAVAAEILKLPKNMRPVAMLPIGVPVGIPHKGPPRLAMDDVVVYK